ncbi:MAG: hypothetical protein DYG99_13225 [Bacteroidetes bacterium CHB5]|nr:hypothetical protein [Bacteroidetes bacterium CHB5]
MKVTLISLLFFAWLIPSTSFSQTEPPKVIPPSPHASALAKYGNIPVSTYTGLPDISIPIYEIKTRDVSVPITLSYHASGIKVSEEASRVGLGWVLNAGGVISRNVVNKDDFLEDVTAYLSSNNISPVIAGGPRYVAPSNMQAGTIASFLDTQNLPNQVNYDLTNFIHGSSYDYEPDQFSYNFMGNSGQFVLGRDGQPVLKKQEKIRLTSISNGSSWEVFTADGFKYVFAATESSSDNSTGNNEQKSAWYLTSITSPSGEVVTFHYVNLGAQYTKPVGQFEESVQAYQFSCSTFVCTPIGNTQGALPLKRYSTIYLSHIKWAHGKVEFVMADREDLEGDKRLQSVLIYRNNAVLPLESYELIESHNLEQSYFNYNVGSNTFPMPDVTTDRLKKRLKLVALSKQSNALEVYKYRFNYYESLNSDQLPPKNSYARDHWGYYNGKGNTSLIPSFHNVVYPTSYEEINGMMGEQRNPSATHMRAFSLKEIIYPTKGKTVFTYGANDYEVDETVPPTIYQTSDFMLFNAAVNRGVVASTLLDLTDQYKSPSGSVIPVEVSAAFRSNPLCWQITGAPDIYFEVTSEDGNTLYGRVSLSMQSCAQPTDRDCIYCDPNQQQMGIFSYKGSITLQPGRYLWRAFVNSQETRFVDISANYTWWVDTHKRSPLGPNIKYALAGGLRVEKIEDFDANGIRTGVRNFDFHYATDVDNNGTPEYHSNGKLMMMPAYSYFDVSWERKQVSDIPPIFSTCLDCAFLIRQSDSFLPATGSHGSAVGYSKVKESIGENGEGGYTIYEYENVKDTRIPFNYPWGSTTYPMRPPSVATRVHGLNGMLLKRTVYSDQGTPFSQLTNTYSSLYNKVEYGLSYRRIRVIGYTLSSGAEILMSIYPATDSYFYYLSGSTETSYDPVGVVSNTVVTTYSYGNQAHLQLTQASKTSSDGHKVVTTYKYPADYSDIDGGTAITQMKQDAAFQHRSPVEITVMDEDAAGNRTLLSRAITVYGIFNGRAFPEENVITINAAPLTLAELPSYIPKDGYSSGLNAGKYNRVYKFNYNSDGNISRVQKDSNIPITYLWGSKKTNPVAEVSNAEVSECFYEGFEEGSFTEDAAAAHTGRKFFTGDYQVSFSIPNSRSYRIEYWYYDGVKWNYKTAGYTGPTTLTEGTSIDDVRIVPVDAFIKTYTYRSLVGVTSMINERGETFKYEYDVSGRLQFIFDETGSIVKKYDYAYKQ